MRFDFCGVELLRFMSFCGFCILTFAVAESQAGELKSCVSCHGLKLSRMVADP